MGELVRAAVEGGQVLAQRSAVDRAVLFMSRPHPERATEAPYGDPVPARATVERVTTSGEVRERVLGATAAVLFGLS
ncbi:hypothetical protein [Nonomuraea phyllanthi]|uniref:hypothetical protein n=1 Tax=Nonomuraea phyllanthi TaxID=2219224 RepID=UPI001D03045F|nr:hypothetical protein [Nonomuraea phyllanthi]